MNKNLYTNIPATKLASNASVQTFDAYYSQPLELNASTLAAITGFFTSRGFQYESAEPIAVLIMKQAKIDGYNPMQILDTLKGLGDIEISALVAEIVNYNRFKTSALGYAQQFEPNYEVQRNIIA